MRRLALTLLALAAVAGISWSHDVVAADYYKETLAPGADAGSLALSTSAFCASQCMLRCEHSVQYKLCQLGPTCTANGNDPTIDPNQNVDICGTGPTSWQLSLFRTYDGGLPNCKLYAVNPVAPGCR